MGNIAAFGGGSTTMDHVIQADQNAVKPVKFSVGGNHQVGFYWNYMFVHCRVNFAGYPCQGQYVGMTNSPLFTMPSMLRDH